MVKIYGTAPVIFDVPAEGGEYHAHVAPRYLHSIYVALDEAKN